MRSRLFLLAVLCVELAACRPIPAPGPPTVTRMAPQPTGAPPIAAPPGEWRLP
jgi:hypothetical protein